MQTPAADDWAWLICGSNHLPVRSVALATLTVTLAESDDPEAFCGLQCERRPSNDCWSFAFNTTQCRLYGREAITAFACAERGAGWTTQFWEGGDALALCADIPLQAYCGGWPPRWQIRQSQALHTAHKQYLHYYCKPCNLRLPIYARGA